MPSLADAELTMLRGAVAGATASDTLADLRLRYYTGPGMTVSDKEYSQLQAALVDKGTLADVRRNTYVFTRPILPNWYSNADMQWNLLVF